MLQRLRLHRRAVSAIVLLGIGMGGLIASFFVNIPNGVCYILAGATLGVEGMSFLEDA